MSITTSWSFFLAIVWLVYLKLTSLVKIAHQTHNHINPILALLADSTTRPPKPIAA